MNGFSAIDLFNVYEKSQWWNREELLTYQRRMLSALVFHARTHSPFYQYRLAPLFSNRGEINWDEWRGIPILTRSDIIKYSNTLRASKIPAEHLPIAFANTSGSAGQPVTVATTNFLRAVILATGWRAQRWHGVNWASPLLTRSYAKSENFMNGENIGTWGPPTEKLSRKGKNFYCHDVTTEQIFDLIIKKRPDYVSIYTGSIDLLCDLAQRRKEFPGVKMFFSRGGAVSDELKKKAHRVFSSSIFEGYSAQECGSIAYACPSGSGLHMNSESVFVEILRDDGEYAMPGEEGNVIVTPLTATAMPLIRYELGDRAIVGEQCQCGRRLPMLRRVIGKIAHSFRHPDGRAHIGARIGPLRMLINASRWQVAQVGPVEFEIRYVSDHDSDPFVFENFINHFRALMFSDSQVRFKRVREISVPKSGKFIEYVNEYYTTQIV